MAVYIADLRSTSGWTERFETGFASVTTVIDGFRITQSTTGMYGFSWNAIDSDANRDKVEILAKVRHANYTASGTFGVGVFARGDLGANCYDAILRITSTASGAVWTQRFDSYSPTTLDGTPEVLPGANTWVWVKLRVNGTDIKSKAWIDGTAEPAAWGYEGVDATYDAAGWVGILSYDAGGDPYSIGYFAVATNGDSLSTGSSGGFFLGADF